MPASPLPAEPLEVVVLARFLMEKPLENVLVCPLTLSVDPFLGLDRFSLRKLSSFLPTWSRMKWWSSFSAHSSHLLFCSPISIIALWGLFCHVVATLSYVVLVCW